MGSIVDVYDALTSDRVYQKGIEPTCAHVIERVHDDDAGDAQIVFSAEHPRQ